MHIEGYAFKSNEKELREEYNARYNEISKFKESMEIETTPDFEKTLFTGVLKEGMNHLTHKDIALIASNDHLPFGGYCEIRGRRFSGAIYDD